MRRFAVGRMVFLLGHTSLIIAGIATGWWILPVLTTLHVCYGRTLQLALNVTQHMGMRDHETDFRMNCRTIYINPVFRFLYWHMNWHIEHHMYAAVPCYRLHRLHKLIQHELPPTPRGLVQTWFQITGIVYREQTEPGWQFTPKVPGLTEFCQRTRAASPSGTDRQRSQCAGRNREAPGVAMHGMCFYL